MVEPVHPEVLDIGIMLNSVGSKIHNGFCLGIHIEPSGQGYHMTGSEWVGSVGLVCIGCFVCLCH